MSLLTTDMYDYALVAQVDTPERQKEKNEEGRRWLRRVKFVSIFIASALAGGAFLLWFSFQLGAI